MFIISVITNACCPVGDHFEQVCRFFLHIMSLGLSLSIFLLLFLLIHIRCDLFLLYYFHSDVPVGFL